MTTLRPVLSLRGRRVSDENLTEDISVPVDVYDLLLPARRYEVKHKVAVLGEVSLTTEFLLRLLHACDDMREEDIAAFFDFNAVELAFVVDEAESRGYIARSGGRVVMSDAGYSLFKEAARPQVFDVHQRVEKTAFDLLSLAPCAWERLEEFDTALPEIRVRDAKMVADASRRVPQSFRKFFSEIANRREKGVAEAAKMSLYSVDHVSPGDRFSALVPVVASVSVKRPAEVQPVLSGWRPHDEVSDRSEVVHGVAAYLDSLKIARRGEDSTAYDTLLHLAPEYLEDYTTRAGLSIHRYFRDMAARAGEMRADRPTIGLIGPLYLAENIKRLDSALRLAPPSIRPDNAVVWCLPQREAWGSTRALGKLVSHLAQESQSQAPGIKIQGPRTVYPVAAGKISRHLHKQFPSRLTRPDNGALPAGLELFLVPHRVVAAIVHAPVGEGLGFPVPLGVLSFDRSVVEQTHRLLQNQLPASLAFVGSTGSLDLGSLLNWMPLDPGGNSSAPTNE